jgi:hypothetical protein
MKLAIIKGPQALGPVAVALHAKAQAKTKAKGQLHTVGNSTGSCAK